MTGKTVRLIRTALNKRFHRRIGCFQRSALHIGSSGTDAAIGPQASNKRVVLPNGHGAAGRQQRRNLFIQGVDVEAIGVVIVATGRGLWIGAISIDTTDVGWWAG